MPYPIDRRVAGFHDIRLDGIVDLTLRAKGAAVLDIGCNRGLVGFELYQNGATLVHGCDKYAKGIETARELFSDLRAVQTQFEVVDLTQGPSALDVFGPQTYDMVLMLATYHKLKRAMPADLLSALVKELGTRTKRFFAWRGTGNDPAANEQELGALDPALGDVGLRRIHTSYISEELGVAAIWSRC